MKYLKTYEGLRDKMTPKSDKEIEEFFIKHKDSFHHVSTDDKEYQTEYKQIAELFGTKFENLYFIGEGDDFYFPTFRDTLFALTGDDEDESKFVFVESINRMNGHDYDSWKCFPEHKVAILMTPIVYKGEDVLDITENWVFDITMFKNEKSKTN